MKSIQATHKTLALLVVLASIVYFESYAFDVLAYHGPFTARYLSIHDLDISGYNDYLTNRYNGFPAFWRLALYPALFLNIHRLIILPNILALIILLVTCKLTIKLNYALTCLAIFINPITLYLFRSGYQDFFVSSSIVSAFILIIYGINELSLKKITLSLGLLVIVSMTKYQGYSQSIIIILIGFLYAILSLRHKKRQLYMVTVVAMIGAVLCSLHVIYNLFSFENPFFPVNIGPFNGPEQNYDDAPTYISLIWPLSNIFNHFASATELDWIFRGVIPNYSLDMHRSQMQFGGIIDNHQSQTLLRTGGTYGPAYLFTLIAFCLSIMSTGITIFHSLGVAFNNTTTVENKNNAICCNKLPCEPIERPNVRKCLTVKLSYFFLFFSLMNLIKDF